MNQPNRDRDAQDAEHFRDDHDAAQHAVPAIIAPDNDDDQKIDPQRLAEQEGTSDLTQNAMGFNGLSHFPHQEGGFVPAPHAPGPMGPIVPGLLTGGMAQLAANAAPTNQGPLYSVNVSALAHYEAQMRDHAAAFANAAAGAAWAAAQLANNIQQHKLLSHSPPMEALLQGMPQGEELQQHMNRANMVIASQTGIATAQDGGQFARGMGQNDLVQGVAQGDNAFEVSNGNGRVANLQTNGSNKAHQRHRDEDYHNASHQPNKRRQRMQYEPLEQRAGPDPNQHEHQLPIYYHHHHMASPLFSIMESSSTTMSNHYYPLEASPLSNPVHHHHIEQAAIMSSPDDHLNGGSGSTTRTLYDPSSDSKIRNGGSNSIPSPFSVQNNSKNKRRHYQQSSCHPQLQKKQQDSSSKDEKRLASSKRCGQLDGNLSKKKQLQNQHPNNKRSSGERVRRNGNTEREVNLIGKTGVAALYELCSKRHWDTPKFVEVSSSSCSRRKVAKDTESETATKKQEQTKDAEESQDEKIADSESNSNLYDSAKEAPGESNRTSVKRKATASTTSSTCSSITAASSAAVAQPLNSFEFLISVVVNDFTYPPGRGGTKASARQDAARKALFGLLPGVAFDFNGILTAMPPSKKHGTTKRQSEDIQPEFSRLAIDQKPSARGDSEHSAKNGDISNEEGDASSILSMETSSLASSSAHGRHNPQNLMGSAVSYGGYYAGPSSGISSASEDDNADSYYASRGASVCSTLLHAMWQIDERIREPPQYTYDVIAPIVSSGVGIARSTSTGTLSSTMDSEGCALRGKASSNGSLSSGTKPRLSTKSHRSTFSCTASLVLHVELKSTDIEDSSTRNSANSESKESSAKRTAESPKQDNPTDSRLKKKRVLETDKSSSNANADVEECDEHPEECRAKRRDSSELRREGDVPEAANGVILEHEGRRDCRRSSITDEIDEKNLGGQSEVDRPLNDEQDEEETSTVARDNQNQKLLEVEGIVATDTLLPNEKTKKSKPDDESTKKSKLGEMQKIEHNLSVTREEISDAAEAETEHATKLEASGTGATKREARHVASAKLLALLFPQCEGTVKVIAAAEEARESYAARKAQMKRKQQTPKVQQSQSRSSKRKPSSERFSKSRQTGEMKCNISNSADSADQISVENLSISEPKKQNGKKVK